MGFIFFFLLLSGFGSFNIKVTSKDLAVVVNINNFGCKSKLIGLKKSKFTTVFRPIFLVYFLYYH